MLILAIWCVASLGAALIVRGLQPNYKADALILVDSQKIPERYVSSTVSTEVQDRIASISQHILSAARLKAIIDEFGLYPDLRTKGTPEELLEQMRKDIVIKPEKGWSGNRPSAFRITFSGQDPNQVYQVANRISVLFVDENLRTREVQAVGTAEFISTQLAEAKKTLDELEAKVSEYKIRHSGELPEQQQYLISSLGQLRSNLDVNRDNMNRAQETKLMLENNLSMAEISLSALEKTSAIERPAPLPPSNVPAAPTRSRILEEAHQALLKRYSPNHPDVLNARRAYVQALEEEKNAPAVPPPPPAVSGSSASAARADAAALQVNQERERVRILKSQIGLADKELASRRAEQERILKDLASLQDRLGRMPIREQDMSQLLRDYETSKTNYRMLLDKKISAEMSTEMERRQKSERFTIIDPARLPMKPVSPNRPLLYTAGCFVGLILGVGMATLLGLRRDLFLGEWELPGDVAVLGRLPVVEIAPATNREVKKRRVGFAF